MPELTQSDRAAFLAAFEVEELISAFAISAVALAAEGGAARLHEALNALAQHDDCGAVDALAAALTAHAADAEAAGHDLARRGPAS